MSPVNGDIWMRYLFLGVEVEHAQVHIVRADDDPVFAGNEFSGTGRQGRNVECLDEGLCLVVPHVDLAAVQGDEHPRLIRMEVDALHSVGAGCEHFLDIEAKAHYFRIESVSSDRMYS